MKDTVQLHVEVSRALWKVMSHKAVEERTSLRALVVQSLEARYGNVGPVAQQVEQGVTKPGRNPGVDGTITGSTPVRPTTLKEDHGWCKGCGVEQVRLPAILCKECRTEAGEDL